MKTKQAQLGLFKKIKYSLDFDFDINFINSDLKAVYESIVCVEKLF